MPMECARTVLSLETLKTDTELMNRHIQLIIKLLCKEEFAEVPQEEAKPLRGLLTHWEHVC